MSGVADHLFEHARRFLNLGDEERIAYIRAPRWIGHQVAQGSHQRLTELLNRPASLRTQGLMLVGPYANGKTMIAERFAVECRKVGTFETSLFLTFDHKDNRDDDIPTGSFT